MLFLPKPMDQVNFIVLNNMDILHPQTRKRRQETFFIMYKIYYYVLADGRDRKHGNFFSAIADAAYRFISFNCKYSFILIHHISHLFFL